MTQILKPMLAGKGGLLNIDYPAAVTPKIDGIRCLIISGTPVSRTLKPIRNKRIKTALTGLPDGLDGELVAISNNFQESTSAVMAADSEIPWAYKIFDYVQDPNTPYSSRIHQLQELASSIDLPGECELLIPQYVYSLSDLRELHQQHIEDGFEGSMVRRPDGRYKFGRSTTNEGLLLKLKEFDDTEAVIVGFEELMHNENEAVVNALGLTERSTHKDNKVPAGTLGAFVVHVPDKPDLIYSVGTGMTQEQRQDYWNNQSDYLGKLIKVKYFAQGMKTEIPRFPVFLGFRDEDDL